MTKPGPQAKQAEKPKPVVAAKPVREVAKIELKETPIDTELIDMKDWLIKLPNGDRGLYTGQMRKDEYLPHGKGTCVFDKGRKYEGQFRNGQYEGLGT